MNLKKSKILRGLLSLIVHTSIYLLVFFPSTPRAVSKEVPDLNKTTKIYQSFEEDTNSEEETKSEEETNSEEETKSEEAEINGLVFGSLAYQSNEYLEKNRLDRVNYILYDKLAEAYVSGNLRKVIEKIENERIIPETILKKLVIDLIGPNGSMRKMAELEVKPGTYETEFDESEDSIDEEIMEKIGGYVRDTYIQRLENELRARGFNIDDLF